MCAHFAAPFRERSGIEARCDRVRKRSAIPPRIYFPEGPRGRGKVVGEFDPQEEESSLRTSAAEVLSADFIHENTTQSMIALTTMPRAQNLLRASSGIHTFSFFAKSAIKTEGITNTASQGVPTARSASLNP